MMVLQFGDWVGANGPHRRETGILQDGTHGNPMDNMGKVTRNECGIWSLEH